MEVLDLQPNTPEWELWRRLKIGASDTPAICGIDPYKKPAKLWHEKFTGYRGFVSDAMMRGKRLEPKARELVCKAHGVEYLEYVVQHEEYGWMGASLDGYCMPFHQGIEIKCPNEKVFNQILKAHEIPKNYLYQMQHQMCVTGDDEWSLIIFNGKYFEELKVARNDEIIEEIIEKGQKFYQSLLNADPIG